MIVLVYKHLFEGTLFKFNETNFIELQTVRTGSKIAHYAPYYYVNSKTNIPISLWMTENIT